MQPAQNQLVITKKDSWKMFNDISPRYDLLNHLLSFGLDIHWRSQLAKYLPGKDNLKVLDLATGTADVLLSLFNRCDRIQTGYGIDMAEQMLVIGEKKVANAGLHNRIILQKGDGHQIPFNNSTFDAATIAFGIRNMDDHSQVLRELSRVLNPKGKVILLEFSLPKNRLLCFLHLTYLRYIVPAMGAIFSGHYKAYQYLNQTIEQFPFGDDFCRIIQNNGFLKASCFPLLFGIASIYVGEKA